MSKEKIWFGRGNTLTILLKSIATELGQKETSAQIPLIFLSNGHTTMPQLLVFF